MSVNEWCKWTYSEHWVYYSIFMRTEQLSPAVYHLLITVLLFITLSVLKHKLEEITSCIKKFLYNLIVVTYLLNFNLIQSQHLLLIHKLINNVNKLVFMKTLWLNDWLNEKVRFNWIQLVDLQHYNYKIDVSNLTLVSWY